MHQTVNVGGEATSLGEAVTSNRIVVGVDGSPGARSALLWAADECRVRRQMLLVVHAPDLADTVAVNHADEPAVRSLDEVGERMLSEHAAAASARQPSVVVTTLLGRTPAADALIGLSADSELIVVGTHGRGGIISSILGSVSYRVAAHAHCPVAVVPERRRPRRKAPSASSSPQPRGATEVSRSSRCWSTPSRPTRCCRPPTTPSSWS